MAVFAAPGPARPGSGWRSHPCSRTPGCSAGASATTATSCARRCTSSPTGAAGDVALRPEGTASVVRAFVQHHPPVPWKAWYVTPAFRYERPQAGRYRQHHQLGVEVLGTDDPDLDVEVIALAARLLRRPGAATGRPGASTPWAAPSAAPGYVAALAAYPRRARRRAVRRAPGARTRANPLRVLDCKRPQCRAVTEDAPRTRRLSRRGLRRPPGPGARRPRRARHSAPARAPARAGSRLLHAHDLRVLGHRARPRPRTPSAAVDATTAWSRRSGADPTPGIGFGIGIERLLLACDAEGVLRGRPARRRRLRRRRDRRGARPVICATSCAGPAWGRCGPTMAVRSRPSSSRPTAPEPASPLIVGPEELAAGVVTVRDPAGGGRADDGGPRGHRWPGCRELCRREMTT